MGRWTTYINKHEEGNTYTYIYLPLEINRYEREGERIWRFLRIVEQSYSFST